MHNIMEMAGLFILPFFIYLGLINLFTYAIFGWDKYRSIKNAWRVSENSLLLLAFMGGSPAMLLGQKFLRHKTYKQPFKTYLLIIVFVQIIAIGFFIYKYILLSVFAA
ncbi:MAG: hypothetical protein COC17_06020 [Hyphomicrobiales bacterium]|nr:DUF1294 domain-containing protein [Hyphomicrobiales bacterium]PCH50126.1 MAG: hypothetical protein COC17_06020 [Hyphomicrobiales bacterium]